MRIAKLAMPVLESAADAATDRQVPDLQRDFAELHSQPESDVVEEAYRKAIALDPAFARAWGNFGVHWQNRGDPSLARSYFEVRDALPLVLAGKATAEQYVLVGREVWANHGSWDDALACAERALAIEPEIETALVLAAWAALEAGDAQAAGGYAARALAADPQGFEALMVETELLLRDGRIQEARDRLRAVADQHARESDHQRSMRLFELFQTLGDAD